jgi:hypothetical protein
MYTLMINILDCRGTSFPLCDVAEMEVLEALRRNQSTTMVTCLSQLLRAFSIQILQYFLSHMNSVCAVWKHSLPKVLRILPAILRSLWLTERQVAAVQRR